MSLQRGFLQKDDFRKFHIFFLFWQPSHLEAGHVFLKSIFFSFWRPGLGWPGLAWPGLSIVGGVLGRPAWAIWRAGQFFLNFIFPSFWRPGLGWPGLAWAIFYQFHFFLIQCSGMTVNYIIFFVCDRNIPSSLLHSDDTMTCCICVPTPFTRLHSPRPIITLQKGNSASLNRPQTLFPE